MSNKTPNEAALQSTRQMLDELDSLMERMLSLPVNDLEDAAPFPKEVVPAAMLTLLQACRRWWSRQRRRIRRSIRRT